MKKYICTFRNTLYCQQRRLGYAIQNFGGVLCKEFIKVFGQINKAFNSKE